MLAVLCSLFSRSIFFCFGFSDIAISCLVIRLYRYNAAADTCIYTDIWTAEMHIATALAPHLLYICVEQRVLYVFIYNNPVFVAVAFCSLKLASFSPHFSCHWIETIAIPLHIAYIIFDSSSESKFERMLFHFPPIFEFSVYKYAHIILYVQWEWVIFVISSSTIKKNAKQRLFSLNVIWIIMIYDFGILFRNRLCNRSI